MRVLPVILCLGWLAAPAAAQTLGTLHPRPLPPLKHPNSASTPAKQLFARKLDPTPGPSEPIGAYWRGCLAGARQLPMTGAAWQVMRPSRDRNWGSTRLISFIERTSETLRAEHVWPGFLVGDMAQPRGGPMINGHASHQIGLDVDIWFKPMPDRQLSRAERETMMSTNLVKPNGLSVNANWNAQRLALVRGVATQPQVQRIFVNPAIKKAICQEARGDRSWLAKVRPMWGHKTHFHIRLFCPANDPACKRQFPVPHRDGCGATLAWWFKPNVLHPKPNPHYKPKPPITLSALPKACRAVLNAPG